MTIKKQSIGNFRDLTVYRKALLFNKEINAVIERLPNHEKYNLIDQMKRASTSVVANITEGNANFFLAKEFDRLNTALGSLAECRAFLDICVMLDYISKEEYQSLDKKAEEIVKMLIGMMKRIEKVIERGAS